MGQLDPRNRLPDLLAQTVIDSDFFDLAFFTDTEVVADLTNEAGEVVARATAVWRTGPRR